MAEGYLYIGDLQKYFYCIDTENGFCLWKFKCEDEIHECTPAIYDGSVYIGDFKGYIYSFECNALGSAGNSVSPQSDYIIPLNEVYKKNIFLERKLSGFDSNRELKKLRHQKQKEGKFIINHPDKLFLTMSWSAYSPLVEKSFNVTVNDIKVKTEPKDNEEYRNGWKGMKSGHPEWSGAVDFASIWDRLEPGEATLRISVKDFSGYDCVSESIIIIDKRWKG